MPRWGNPPVQYFSLFIHVYMISVVICLGELLCLLGKVTLSAREIICHVNISRWGNLPGRGCREFWG